MHDELQESFGRVRDGRYEDFGHSLNWGVIQPPAFQKSLSGHSKESACAKLRLALFLCLEGVMNAKAFRDGNYYLISSG